MVVDFTIVSRGSCAAGIVTVFEEIGLSGVPEGGVATTDAVFTMLPPSRSAWVTV